MLWHHKVEVLSLFLIVIIMIIKPSLRHPETNRPGTQIKCLSISKETKSLFHLLASVLFSCVFSLDLLADLYREWGRRGWVFPFSPPWYILKKKKKKKVSVRCSREKSIVSLYRSFFKTLCFLALAGHADTCKLCLGGYRFYCGF